MKKFLLCFFVLIAIVFFLPAKALASDSVNLSKFYIYSTINEDGSVSMKELITFDFDGSYNGAYRDISTRNTDGIYGVNVALVSKSASEVPFRHVESAENGDKDVFELIKQDDDLYRIKIYTPSRNEKRTFQITYTMKNVATRYKDTGEFFYDYWSSGNETEIDDLKIHVVIPKVMETGDIKAYYHGVLNGRVSVKNESVDYAFQHVGSNELVETRVLFPQEAISKSANVKNEDKLKDILNEEFNYKKQLEAKMARSALVAKIFNAVSTALGLLFIIIVFNVWRRLKYDSRDEYSVYVPFDIPEECTPAVAAYLVNGSVNGRTLYATILDLWRKDYLSIRKVETESKKHKADFIMTKNNKNLEGLLKHEIYFMAWLFETIGDGETVALSSIRKASENGGFDSKFGDWTYKIKDEAKSRNYYDKRANSAGVKLIAISIAAIIFSIVAIVLKAYLGVFSMLVSVFVLICGIYYCFRRSQYGKSQYEKWIKFRNYIKNTEFTYNEDTGYIEKYIPYAEALNMEKNSMGKLKSVFENTSPNMGWIYYYLIFDSMNLDEHEQFSYYMYNSFNTGSSGDSGTGSYGGGSSGSSGGGGAGGF
ncbi:MAG: DUF2207 domain-containing protein [Clostridium sp.]|uniref:DUF2207 domain-containing protein n=1 Tax=Clostridium sp. TaxID=1506 RepID=UPI0025BAA2E6|nr:DUF2207 domain-containing protein [Clostridium sp.]MCH3963328.1 DUF2207 domain-containing protein [Clostridium sp.]MCI1716804.1 DUF2207 domain-containing protein [Clostridium sp.]MCI1801012.1 DUF2207 domain-containing protein [Clostridium sp.]MCI1814990.1 DUF2207 domain-containing protein [Clostridium sp.]MCI1871891.1 DUF2207 domain-containing protein [Clostridium sp.]